MLMMVLLVTCGHILCNNNNFATIHTHVVLISLMYNINLIFTFVKPIYTFVTADDGCVVADVLQG
jgi:hypothetical protein